MQNLNNIEVSRRVNIEMEEDEGSSGESSVCEQPQKQRVLTQFEVEQMVLDPTLEQTVNVEPKPSQKKYVIPLLIYSV